MHQPPIFPFSYYSPLFGLFSPISFLTCCRHYEQLHIGDRYWGASYSFRHFYHLEDLDNYFYITHICSSHHILNLLGNTSSIFWDNWISCNGSLLHDGIRRFWVWKLKGFCPLDLALHYFFHLHMLINYGNQHNCIHHNWYWF